MSESTIINFIKMWVKTYFLKLLMSIIECDVCIIVHCFILSFITKLKQNLYLLVFVYLVNHFVL